VLLPAFPQCRPTILGLITYMKFVSTRIRVSSCPHPNAIPNTKPYLNLSPKFAGLNGTTMFYTLRLLLGLAEAGTFPGLWYQLTLFFSTAEVLIMASNPFPSLVIMVS